MSETPRRRRRVKEVRPSEGQRQVEDQTKSLGATTSNIRREVTQPNIQQCRGRENRFVNENRRDVGREETNWPVYENRRDVGREETNWPAYENRRDAGQERVNLPHYNNLRKVSRESPKQRKVPIISIISVILVACLAAGYFFILQPQQKLSQAESLISRGKYSEAEIVLSQLGNSEKKNDLLVQITLAEIEESIQSGDYSGAERKMRSIPEGRVSPELRAKLAFKQAEAYMIQGKYADADQTLASIEQTDEVGRLREELSYESRVFSCIKAIKKVLKNPNSLSIYEVEFHKATKKDKEKSTKENPVYVDTEPSCIMHYGAQNGFGGNTTSYAIFTWGDEEYEFLGAVNSLSSEDLDEDSDDYLYDVLTLVAILDAMKSESVGSFDLERIQTLLKNNSYGVIKVIK